MDINDNKLKKFYTVSAAIGYILCSLYAFIYCASYGLVHLHLPISSESVLSGVSDDFFYFSEATIVVLLVFAIVCVGSYLALLFIAFDKGHRPLPFRLSIIAFAAFGLSCAEFDNYKIDLRLFCTVLAAVFLLIGVYTAVLCVRNARSCAKQKRSPLKTSLGSVYENKTSRINIRAGIIAMPAPCVIYLYFFRTASSSRSIRSSPSIRRAFSACVLK